MDQSFRFTLNHISANLSTLKCCYTKRISVDWIKVVTSTNTFHKLSIFLGFVFSIICSVFLSSSTKTNPVPSFTCHVNCSYLRSTYIHLTYTWWTSPCISPPYTYINNFLIYRHPFVSMYDCVHRNYQAYFTRCRVSKTIYRYQTYPRPMMVVSCYKSSFLSH